MFISIRSTNRARIQISDDISHFKWLCCSLSRLFPLIQTWWITFSSLMLFQLENCVTGRWLRLISAAYGGVCSPNGVLTLLGYWDWALKDKGAQRNFCVWKGREHVWSLCLSSNGESTESQAACIEKLSVLFSYQERFCESELLRFGKRNLLCPCNDLAFITTGGNWQM